MNQSFFQRVASSLIVPITFLPLAALLLAIGTQLGIEPVEAAGLALIRSWLPLFYGIGISIGFTGADGMGALSVASGFVVMVAVAEAVARDSSLNVGVLGGILVGALCTWLFNRVKGVQLPEFLALFSGKRMGPLVSAVAGLFLGYLFGYFWPPIQAAVVTLGHWVAGAGAVGVFTYGALLRLMIPTGLHHILLQLVDTQLGGWVDPATGKLVAGEYLRFLAGDPAAGRILSGFFLSLGFGPIGAAMAITHEARPEQRRKVAGLMTTAALTAAVLGVTEPVEFAFIFASPVLYGLHVVFSGAASLVTWALNIHLGGYALPMILINWHRSQNGLLLLPLGLLYTAVYYYSFRAVIRWLRPPILGQILQPDGQSTYAAMSAAGAAEGRLAEEEQWLSALGGLSNILSLDACMTRLRLRVRDPEAVSRAQLERLGSLGIVRAGEGHLQVVVGSRAGELGARLGERLSDNRQGDPVFTVLTLCSPLTGRVIPLEQVPDPVFAGRLAGEGVAIEPTDGLLLSPARGTVLHLSPGGHAFGLVTPEGIEVLVHIGIETVALKGDGFDLELREGDQLHAGQPIGRVDLQRIAALGKSLITPVLVTNPDAASGVAVVPVEQVVAGSPLLRVTQSKGRN